MIGGSQWYSDPGPRYIVMIASNHRLQGMNSIEPLTSLKCQWVAFRFAQWEIGCPVFPWCFVIGDFWFLLPE